jgi:hypothetical protein
MSVGLSSAKVDIPDARVNLSGVHEMRSSVEVKNSCNCFQNCFPCFKKKPKKDPRSIREQKTVEIMRSALAPAPVPSDGRLVRSPNMDTVSHPHMSIDIHIDSGNNPRDLDQAARVLQGDFS